MFLRCLHPLPRRGFLGWLGAMVAAASGEGREGDVGGQDKGPREWEVSDVTRPSDERRHAALAREARRSELAATVSNCIDSLFAANDYAVLESLPRTWRKTLAPEVQRELTVQLFAYLESDRGLELAVPDNVVIRAVESSDRPGPQTGIVKVSENILTEGGRAEWAIREFLLVSPRLLLRPPPRTVRFAQEIIRAMNMPPWSRLETLSKAEQVRLGSWADADPRLLRELAKSPKVEVRLAVARNYRTSLDTLDGLLQDPILEVREAARLNKQHARALGVD